MWEPRRLTALWAFTACYRDSFTFFCSTLRRIWNNKTRKDAQITFYKAKVVPTFTYGSEIWNITNKKKGRKN
jgi:hypothetical protein